MKAVLNRLQAKYNIQQRMSAARSSRLLLLADGTGWPRKNISDLMARPRLLWLLVMLLLAVLFSAWFSRGLGHDEATTLAQSFQEYGPDVHMSRIDTLILGEPRQAGYRMQAEHLFHYPAEDTTELVQPQLLIFRPHAQDIQTHAKHGWLAADNQVALLYGQVRLFQNDQTGGKTLSIETAQIGIVLAEEYAESKASVRLNKGRATLLANGIRAYLSRGRMEFDDHVETRISPAASRAG